MPIPDFDLIKNVIPPFINDPTDAINVSPHKCTIEELIKKFSTSPERKNILEGLLKLRIDLFNLGIEGFQWLDGSFVENVEIQHGVPPNDIDVVTYVDESLSLQDLKQKIPCDILNPSQTKKKYFVDHYLVPLSSSPKHLVSLTTYWFGLFSHRRHDHLRKGILFLELKDSQIEEQFRSQGW